MIGGDVDSHLASIVAVLVLLTAISMIVERIMNFVFSDLRLFRQFFRSNQTGQQSKPILSLAFCLAITFTFQADAFSVVFPNADIYKYDSEQIEDIANAEAAVAETAEKTVARYEAELALALAKVPEPNVFGLVLTAFLLAGGSAGLMTLMQETLGMSRDARKAKQLQRQAATSTPKTSGTNQAPKVKSNAKTGFGGTRS